MKPFLKSGATILLTTDGTWQWTGWDGRLTVSATAHSLHLSNAVIITDADVPAFTLLAPRQYTAMAFSDTPGMISNALFMDDKDTLSDKIKVNGAHPLLNSTTGTFTCTCELPSTRITPGGPVPDPLLAKLGTWKVVDPNQHVFIRNTAIPDRHEPCVEARVAHMSHQEKIMAAINKSDISDAFLAEIDVKAMAVSMVASGAVLLGLAATGYGAIAEVIAGGLLLAGAALSGIELGAGIMHLADFYNQTKDATTCSDLAEAGQSFGQAVAKIGVGGVSAVLSVAGARKMSAKVSKPGEVKSLLKGRKEIKVWLQNVGKLEREQLISDLENAGFKKIHEKGGRTIMERGNFKVRLDPPDKATPYNHMHLTRGSDKETYDMNLKKVDYRLKEAHIKTK